MVCADIAALEGGGVYLLDNTARVWLPAGLVAVLTTVLVVGVVTEPDRYALGFAPEQPLPFSHKLHAGDNEIPCGYCHSGATRSRYAQVPQLSKCLNCHNVTRTDSPYIEKIRGMVEAGKPLRWKRVYALPDHVYFNHQPHIGAGIECQECHGPVETMEVLERAMNMRMGKCLECHRGEKTYVVGPKPAVEGPTNCWACHR